MRPSSRPIIERLPCLRLKDICKLIPRNPHHSYQLDAYGWRYPGRILLSYNGIKITDAAIVPQFFTFAWVKTGAGKQRPVIVCQCRRKAQVLYFHNGRYACKHCHRAQYISERQSKAGRKLWKAAKKRIEVNSVPSRFHSISPKAKGRHSKRYARLVAEIQHLEQQAKHSRIKDFDIKALAYHLQ